MLRIGLGFITGWLASDYKEELVPIARNLCKRGFSKVIGFIAGR